VKFAKFISWCCLCFILTMPSYAQVEGQGRFQATDADSITFVRNQLLSEAVRDVVKKELTAMNLNAEGFFQRWNQRLEQSFDAINKEIREKHKVDQQELNSRQRQAFETELRARRLALKANYGGLTRAMTSYSIKNQSRSTQGGGTRFMTIDARVDRRVLNSIYSDFMREGRARYFRNLILSLNVDLKDAAWNEVGVQVQSDLTRVLEQHWSTQLRSRLSRQVGQIIVANEEINSNINQFFKMPLEHSSVLEGEVTTINLNQDDLAEEITVVETQYVIDALDTQTDQERDGGDSSLEMNHFVDSLWLKINVQLTKVNEDIALGTRTFKYEGDFLLIDLRHREFIHAFSFTTETHQYSVVDLHQLSSSIATQIARMPRGEFDKIPRSLGQLRADRAQVQLVLHQMNSLQDYYHFGDLLTQVGLTKEFNPKLVRYEGKMATIHLSYKGDPMAMADMLRSINRRSLKSESIVEIESLERPYQFTLRRPLNEVPINN
jgi:hypothetical protein